jgi:hypothetical protein
MDAPTVVGVVIVEIFHFDRVWCYQESKCHVAEAQGRRTQLFHLKVLSTVGRLFELLSSDITSQTYIEVRNLFSCASTGIIRK